MNETEARRWVADLDVPCGTIERLDRLVQLVVERSAEQNLVAASTLPSIWQRHIVDSLQLLPIARKGSWVDVGSGAGFPGLAVACARLGTTTLVEPRRLRADFLHHAATTLGLDDRVSVASVRVERLTIRTPPAVISARAVAPLDRLFEAAHHLAVPDTVWLLMKGATAREELEAARRSWQGDIRLVPSITDNAASIVVATDVRRRG